MLFFLSNNIKKIVEISNFNNTAEKIKLQFFISKQLQ